MVTITESSTHLISGDLNFELDTDDLGTISLTGDFTVTSCPE